ncbi:MAG: hypothetical protein FJ379_05625 [Verrucomicrobia bacterium]|nr:hypothetical protein [Verrucomicrobiota bacterium]
MKASAPRLVRDRHGVRLVHHGVLISDLRTSVRPTHGLYDILAAVARLASEDAPRHIALLGFGAGGILAPWNALGWTGCLNAVDTDPDAYALFRRECPLWRDQVRWTQADAVEWLVRERRRFSLIIEDLSISTGSDIEKPGATWNRLPGLLRDRLAPEGIALFNLLKPQGGTWRQGLDAVGGRFPRKLLVHLEDYENRILIAGRSLPEARTLSAMIRRSLRSVGSCQADRFRLETLG